MRISAAMGRVDIIAGSAIKFFSITTSTLTKIKKMPCLQSLINHVTRKESCLMSRIPKKLSPKSEKREVLRKS